MATPREIQDLLRFLSQDAKIPIAKAMGCIKGLKIANIASVQLIANSNQETLEPIFEDSKYTKQVINAAKRVSKKRANSNQAAQSPAKKKARTSAYEIRPAEDTELSLALPEPILDEELISKTILITNRAPVVLAFGVVLLKYTMPEQPLSSRLSLSQAAVSMNSRTKAVSLGIEQGKSAEEEGWGQGQASIRVMGRSVRTMKRVGWRSEQKLTPSETQDTTDSGETLGAEVADEKPALWALDLEALKNSAHGASNDGTGVGLASNLPIYTPQSARSYLMRAFSVRKEEDAEITRSKKPSSTAKSYASRTEENVSLLLGSLDLLFQSWTPHLNREELDRRTWNWYVQVRPTVEDGVRGWGAKGELRLADILSLRRKP